jgi:hypothetical protein
MQADIVNFASRDQTCGENFLFGFFITLTWEDCFVFGFKINLDNLGVICISIKIEMHLMMGVILCTSKKIIAQPSMEDVWS